MTCGCFPQLQIQVLEQMSSNFQSIIRPGTVAAQYVNCAAANPGADAGMYDASEQYKLSTWQQVPHRGSPFRDKGGLRGQRQKRVLFEKDTT